jgi:hypothetical protein
LPETEVRALGLWERWEAGEELAALLAAWGPKIHLHRVLAF